MESNRLHHRLPRGMAHNTLVDEIVVALAPAEETAGVGPPMAEEDPQVVEETEEDALPLPGPRRLKTTMYWRRSATLRGRSRHTPSADKGTTVTAGLRCRVLSRRSQQTRLGRFWKNMMPSRKRTRRQALTRLEIGR